jgi:hypothetical protein
MDSSNLLFRGTEKVAYFTQFYGVTSQCDPQLGIYICTLTWNSECNKASSYDNRALHVQDQNKIGIQIKDWFYGDVFTTIWFRQVLNLETSIWFKFDFQPELTSGTVGEWKRDAKGIALVFLERVFCFTNSIASLMMYISGSRWDCDHLPFFLNNEEQRALKNQLKEMEAHFYLDFLVE